MTRWWKKDDLFATYRFYIKCIKRTSNINNQYAFWYGDSWIENNKIMHVYLKKFGHVVHNVYICTYGFERKFWCMLYLTIKATLVTTYL